jgi:hypothetical protein
VRARTRLITHPSISGNDYRGDVSLNGDGLGEDEGIDDDEVKG